MWSLKRPDLLQGCSEGGTIRRKNHACLWRNPGEDRATAFRADGDASRPTHPGGCFASASTGHAHGAVRRTAPAVTEDSLLKGVSRRGGG
jgi:hypothetical protein